jgi:hypothetical protein
MSYRVMKVLCVTLINCTVTCLKVYLSNHLHESEEHLNELIKIGSKL